MNVWPLTAAALLLCAVVGSANAFCPVGCLCDDEKLQVTCDDVNLEVIPITLNPSVQRLVLKKNKIKSVDTALRFYVELLYVDFSRNKLVAIQDRSFEAQRKLVELRLEHNKISSISNGTWIGLSRDLTILSMRENYLSALEERTFATAGNLRELDLGQNQIEYIHPEAFAGLPELRIIYLDDNKLGYHAPSWPMFLKPLAHLVELSMAGNELPWLADGLFEPLTELVQLDLSACRLRNVSTDAFRGLDQLRELRLNDNLLSSVPSQAWPSLIHLESLHLGQNNITAIGPAAFVGLDRLKQLDVSDSALLSSIDGDALVVNRDLSQLIVSNCKQLSAVPDKLLMHTTNLRRLVLSNNGLVTLSDKFLMGPVAQSLQVLDVGDNPFECDCRLLWLRDYLLLKQDHVGLLSPGLMSSTPARIRRHFADLEHQQLESPAPIECTSPLTVANLALHTLSEDQLGCRLALFSSPQSLAIGLSILVGLIVLCVAFLLCHYRRRLRVCCCCPGDSKSHPKCSEDSRTLASKWRPASPNTWGSLSGNSNINNGGLHHQSVSLIGSRTPEYHKTCTNEEECFMRAVTLHNTLKPFPRTEL